jgi:hypothetical protein
MHPDRCVSHSGCACLPGDVGVGPDSGLFRTRPTDRRFSPDGPPKPGWARRRPACPGLRGARASIPDDREDPLFRPIAPDATRLIRRHLIRKTTWRLVKKDRRAAGIDPDRLRGRGISIHALPKTAINDAIRNGASMHEVREFVGRADIRTTEVDFVRREQDAEVEACGIQIRLTDSRGQ